MAIEECRCYQRDVMRHDLELFIQRIFTRSG